MEAERFLLKWNNHQSNLINVFDQLLEQEAFTDVTLACDGKSFSAHKVILSACSPYFQSLFIANPNTHPIVFMRDVRGPDMESLLAFMYRGEINVHQQDLASFLKTAESLQIKGLSDSSERQRDTSKILEAMEKKFNTTQNNNNISTCNNNPVKQVSSIGASSISNTSTSPTFTPSNSAFSLPRVTNALSNLNSLRFGSSLNGSLNSAYNSLAASLPVLGAVNGYSDRASEGRSPPPTKRHRAFEDLPRIMPKVRGSLISPPSLINNLPGLLTPISLAAAAVNSVSSQPQMPILANTPTSVHSSPPIPETSHSSMGIDAVTPIKDRIKRGYQNDLNNSDHKEKNGQTECGLNLSDSPQPFYLSTSIGSGSSTPSLEVKDEDGELIDDSSMSLSDEPHNMHDDGHMDSSIPSLFPEEGGISTRERLSYPCRYCGKRFTQTGTCRRHERLHTAPNGFKCPFCQKGFNRKYRLKEHIISSHPGSADDADISMLVNSVAAASTNSLA